MTYDPYRESLTGIKMLMPAQINLACITKLASAVTESLIVLDSCSAGMT